MAFEKNQRPTEDEEIEFSVGDKKYSRLLRVFREGYISVVVYKNCHEYRTFFDTVIFRKIKVKCNGKRDLHNGSMYKRGANLKPEDLPIVIRLLIEAAEFIKVIEKEETSAR